MDLRRIPEVIPFSTTNIIIIQLSCRIYAEILLILPKIYTMGKLSFLTPKSLMMALIALLFSSGCNSNHERPVVAVSIPPQAELLRAIAGDSIEIVTLMQSEANPENFEVTVATLKEISSADAYFKIGNIPFETVITDKIGANSDLRFFDNSEGIELIYGTHSHSDHSHSVPDPHIWSSARNLKQIAANMCDALVEIDPDREQYYRANLSVLNARLDSVDSALSCRLAPCRGASFLIWHPSLSYFARDYGLHQIAVGQENKESSIAGLQKVLREAGESNVRALFVQSSFDPAQAGNISRQLNLDVTSINPLSANWEAEFNTIADAITATTD